MGVIRLKLIYVLFFALIISPAILPVVEATFPLPATGQWLSPVVVNNYVYLLFNGHTIRAFNIDTGVEDPTRSISISGIGGFPTGMVHVDNLFFVMTDTDNVYAFNLNGDRVSSRDFALDADDNIALFNTSTHIYALVEVGGTRTEYKAYDFDGDRAPLSDVDYPSETYNLTTTMFEDYLLYLNEFIQSPNTDFIVDISDIQNSTIYQHFTIAPETNNGRASFLFFHETEMFVLDNAASPNIIYDYVVPEQIYGVTEVTSRSVEPTVIFLDWEEPYVFPPSILSGYNINYTTPYGDPLISIAENHQGTSIRLPQLSVDNEYSFRVSALSITGHTNASGVITNTTTLHPLRLGNLDVDATNTERVNFIWKDLVRVGESTTATLSYSRIMQLECYYDGKLNRAKVPLPVEPVRDENDDRRDVISYTFVNATNDIITIYCDDTLTNNSTRFLIPQQSFLLLEQIESFRSGEYGTDGSFGAFDFVALTVVILAMIGFNRVNETVGIIMSMVIIGITAFLGIFSLEGLALAMVAVFIMLGIAQTRK